MGKGRNYSPERRPRPKPVINSQRKVKIPTDNVLDTVADIQGCLEMIQYHGCLRPTHCDPAPVISGRRASSVDVMNRRDRVRDAISQVRAASPTMGGKVVTADGEQAYHPCRRPYHDHPCQKDHFRGSGSPHVPAPSLGDSGRFYRPTSPLRRPTVPPAASRSNTTHIFGSKSEADLQAAYAPTLHRSSLGDTTMDKSMSDFRKGQARRKSFAIEHVVPRPMHGLGSITLEDVIPTHDDLLARVHERDHQRARCGSVGSVPRDTQWDIFGWPPRRSGSVGGGRCASAPRSREECHGKRHITTATNNKDSSRVMLPTLLDTPPPRRTLSCSPQRVGRNDMGAVLSAGSPARCMAPNGQSFTRYENPAGLRTSFSAFKAPKMEPRPYTPNRLQESQLWGILGSPSANRNYRSPSPSCRGRSPQSYQQSSIVFC